MLHALRPTSGCLLGLRAPQPARKVGAVRIAVRYRAIGRRVLALPHYRAYQRVEGAVSNIPLNLPQLGIDQFRRTVALPDSSSGPDALEGTEFKINPRLFVDMAIRSIPWKRRRKELPFLQFVCESINANLTEFSSPELVKLVLAFSTLARKRKQRELIFYDGETFRNLFQGISLSDGSVNSRSFLPLLRAYVRMATSGKLASLGVLDPVERRRGAGRSASSSVMSAPEGLTGATGSLAELNMLIARSNEQQIRAMEEQKKSVSSTGGGKAKSSSVVDFDDILNKHTVKAAALSQCLPVIRAMCDKACRDEEIQEALTESNLVETAQLLAAIRLRHVELCDAIADRFTLRFDCFSENDIGRLCRAFGQLRVKPEGFFEMLNSELAYRIHTFHHWNLIDIAEAYSALHIADSSRRLQIAQSTSTDLDTEDVAKARDLVERFGREMFKHIFVLKGSYHARALRVLARLEVGDERTFRGLVRGIPRRAHTLPTELAADTIIAAAKIGMGTTTKYHVLRGGRFFKIMSFHLGSRFHSLRGKHICELVKAFGKARHQEPEFFDLISKHVLEKPQKFHLDSLVAMANAFSQTGYYFNRNNFVADQAKKFMGEVETSDGLIFSSSKLQARLQEMRRWCENEEKSYPLMEIARERILESRPIEMTQLSQRALVSLFHLVSSEEDFFGVRDARNTAVLQMASRLLVDGKGSGVPEDTAKTDSSHKNPMDSLYLTPILDKDFDSTQSFLAKGAPWPHGKPFYSLPVDLFWELLDALEHLAYTNSTLSSAVWGWINLFADKLDIFHLLKISEFLSAVQPCDPLSSEIHTVTEGSDEAKGKLHLKRQLVTQTPLIHQKHLLKLLFNSYAIGLHKVGSANLDWDDNFKLLYQRTTSTLDDVFMEPSDRHRAKLLRTALRLEQARTGGNDECFPEYKEAFCSFVEKNFLSESALSVTKPSFSAQQLGLSSSSLATLLMDYRSLRFNVYLNQLTVDMLIPCDEESCSALSNISGKDVSGVHRLGEVLEARANVDGPLGLAIFFLPGHSNQSRETDAVLPQSGSISQPLRGDRKIEEAILTHLGMEVAYIQEGVWNALSSDRSRRDYFDSIVQARLGAEFVKRKTPGRAELLHGSRSISQM